MARAVVIAKPVVSGVAATVSVRPTVTVAAILAGVPTKIGKWF